MCPAHGHRYLGPPDRIRWPFKTEGATYDSDSAKGKRIVRGEETPFDLFEWAAKEKQNFGDFMKDRHPPAYGVLGGDEGKQGPHLLAHIAKRMAAELANLFDKNFDEMNIPERTGLIPSAGQVRRS